MIELDQSLVRRLTEWDTAGAPVTSLYLTVDGRRYPRRSDVEPRLDEQLRRLRAAAQDLDRAAARSVERDAAALSAYVRDGFERGDTRGLALFSSHAAGLWEEVRLPRPVRDRVVVGPQVDVLPLRELLETYHTMCVALVDFEKARLFLVEIGRIREIEDVWDEVPGRHDQGGWAQMRMQRHVDDHRQQHVKRVADAMLRLQQRRGCHHVVLAGPAEAHLELERQLHDYVRQRVRARLTMSMSASSEEVLRRSLEVEERLEWEAERQMAERLLESAAAGTRAVTGLPGTLGALAEGRVSELVVAIDLSADGGACPACGRLCDHAGPCPACGATLTPLPDVVEAAVARAIRAGATVVTLRDGSLLGRVGGVGAVLRF